jgi:hypothetical protein
MIEEKSKENSVLVEETKAQTTGTKELKDEMKLTKDQLVGVKDALTAFPEAVSEAFGNVVANLANVGAPKSGQNAANIEINQTVKVDNIKDASTILAENIMKARGIGSVQAGIAGNAG